MKPKSIGIVGGAGPLAGAYLLERILSLAMTQYDCYRDADFPKIILISYPFSDILTLDVDVAKAHSELSQCLAQLRAEGASVLVIACNTLHIFLNLEETLDDLVQLPLALAQQLYDDVPLILCTATSARSQLHKRFFPCTYPDQATQQRVDELIDQILRGVERKIVLRRIRSLIAAQEARTVILGCTELSIFAQMLDGTNKVIIDPLEIVAEQALQRSFATRR